MFTQTSFNKLVRVSHKHFIGPSSSLRNALAVEPSLPDSELLYEVLSIIMNF